MFVVKNLEDTKNLSEKNLWDIHSLDKTTNDIS